nr:VP1 [sicinivirus A1]
VQGDEVVPANASPDDGINALEQNHVRGPPSMEVAPYFSMFTKAWMSPLKQSEPDEEAYATSPTAAAPIVAYLTEAMSLPQSVDLSPSMWVRSVHTRGTSSLLTQAISSCFYFRADLDIELMITIPAISYASTVQYPAICVQYHPPGSTIIQPQESQSATVFNTPSASVYTTAFPRLPVPKASSGAGSSQAVTYHLNLSVPYSAINPMVPSIYSGTTVDLKKPQDAVYAAPDSLGRLYIFFMRDGCSNTDCVLGDLRLRLRNFTPAVARLPLLALAYDTVE